jgi:hypothetical protein
MYNYYLSLILLFLFFFSGCTNKPPELTDIYPVTITVANNNTPVEGVQVLLSSKNPQSLRSCNGITDIHGVAKIQTVIREYAGNGVEAGNYTVVLI